MKMEKVYKTELDEFERQNKEDDWDYNFFVYLIIIQC